MARYAIDSCAKGRILLGIVCSVLAIGVFAFAICIAWEGVEEFKNATGTDFSDACLKSVDFTDATLSNCKFDDAETSYVNWTNVNGKRSDINFKHKQI